MSADLPRGDHPAAQPEPTSTVCDCPEDCCFARPGACRMDATQPAVRTGEEREVLLRERMMQAAYRNGYRDGQRATLSTPPPVSGTATDG